MPAIAGLLVLGIILGFNVRRPDTELLPRNSWSISHTLLPGTSFYSRVQCTTISLKRQLIKLKGNNRIVTTVNFLLWLWDYTLDCWCFSSRFFSNRTKKTKLTLLRFLVWSGFRHFRGTNLYRLNTGFVLTEEHTDDVLFTAFISLQFAINVRLFVRSIEGV